MMDTYCRWGSVSHALAPSKTINLQWEHVTFSTFLFGSLTEWSDDGDSL